MSTTPEMIDLYFAAWNEPDAAARQRLLEQCWAADGTLISPNGEERGHAAVSARISAFHTRWPGARVLLASGIDAHHHILRYGWEIRAADGAPLLEGLDVGEQAEDDRLRRVVMFFGPLPAKTA